MNSEPIIKEVEETFYLSIPQTRVEVLDNILSKNPEISSSVVRDLVLSTAIGVRVPNPRTHEPDDAFSRIDTLLTEFWYNIRQVTAKTIRFEPIDIILNPDRGTISLHVRWTYRNQISESTMFINYKNFESFAQFSDDLYNKLNRSLHTNMIPYRLVFLDYGKMSRLACVTLSAARTLLDEGKLVFGDIHKDVRENNEDPQVNDALVPTLNELLEGHDFHLVPGDQTLSIEKDQAEQITDEIKTILALHPDQPEISIEVQIETLRKRKPDGLANKRQALETKTFEVSLSGTENKTFILDATSYGRLGNYINAVLPETESNKKFYCVKSDFECETLAYVCCTAEDREAFQNYGYMYDKEEPWQQNIDATAVPEKIIEETPIPDMISEPAEKTADTDNTLMAPETEHKADTAENAASKLSEQSDKVEDPERPEYNDIPDELLSAVISDTPEQAEETPENNISISETKPDEISADIEISVDIEMAEELEKVLTAQLDEDLDKTEETPDLAGAEKTEGSSKPETV